jgi:hypothetical protein
MTVRLAASLFVGGGTIESKINIAVNSSPLQKPEAKSIFISELTIGIIGVEEINDGRRKFLSLATDVFNKSYPPPMTLVDSQIPISHSELFWALKPASASVAFCINLLLGVGHPPYTSKDATIRYFICPTVAVKSWGKQSNIGQMCNIQILIVYNPEKALASLPKPLLAPDLLSVPLGAEVHRVELTGHRQAWINESVIYVVIHVANRSS